MQILYVCAYSVDLARNRARVAYVTRAAENIEYESGRFAFVFSTKLECVHMIIRRASQCEGVGDGIKGKYHANAFIELLISVSMYDMLNCFIGFDEV